MATWIIKVLIIEFALVACVASIEKNWALAGYGLGAAILNFSILFMKG